jgi:hypothetical protein
MKRLPLPYFFLTALLMLFLAGLLAACGETAVPSPAPVPIPSPTAALSPTTGASGGRAQGSVTPLAGYSLRVLRGGQVLKALTAQDIDGLPQQVPEIGGRPMNGASVRAVLGLAGVQDAQEITVRGTDSTRSGPATVTLPWSGLTDDVLLGVNKRGAAKFFGPNLPGDQWVVDVTEIEVK